MNWLSIGALNLAIAVACGAFGAHALKARLTLAQLNWWQVGTQYFFYHALGLLLVGLLIHLKFIPSKIAWLLQIGIVLFVGSLYLLAMGAPRWLGAITPIGGTLFIVAWVWLAISVAKLKF